MGYDEYSRQYKDSWEDTKVVLIFGAAAGLIALGTLIAVIWGVVKGVQSVTGG